MHRHRHFPLLRRRALQTGGLRLLAGLAALANLAAACAPVPPRTRPLPPARAQPGADDPYRLPIAPPGRTPTTVRITPGVVRAAATGNQIPFATLVQRLAKARVAFVGERHDHREHHALQARLIRALGRSNAPLLVGLEMLEQQRGLRPLLDAYVAGRIHLRTLLAQADWYRQWGFDSRYYRPIFAAARAVGARLVPLNLHAALVRTVARRGIRALPGPVRATLDPLWRDAPNHLRVFRALLGLPAPRPRTAARTASRRAAPTPPAMPGTAGRRPHGAPPRNHPGHHRHRGLLRRLFAAQVLRDEAMAFAIARALATAPPRARMLVCVGAGHLLYGTGVNARLGRRAPELSQRTVIPVPAPPTGRSVSRWLGDFLVGTAEHGPAQRFPALGLRLRALPGGAGLRVTRVAHGASAARRADLRANDVILAVDGRPVSTAFALRWAWESLSPGQSLRLQVRRDGQTVDIRLRSPAGSAARPGGAPRARVNPRGLQETGAR